MNTGIKCGQWSKWNFIRNGTLAKNIENIASFRGQ